jgi:hypothetical protein
MAPCGSVSAQKGCMKRKNATVPVPVRLALDVNKILSTIPAPVLWIRIRKNPKVLAGPESEKKVRIRIQTLL